MAERSVILCTAGYDHTIRFWEAPTGNCIRTLQYPESQVNCLEITADKHLLAACGHKFIRVFDTLSGEAICAPIDAHAGNVTSIGFQRDGRWMWSGGEDGSVKIWDLRCQGFQRHFQLKAPINTMVLHPNQGELIAGDEVGNISNWDLAANQCSAEFFPGGPSPIRSVSIASDASLLVAANNKGTCFIIKPLAKSQFETVQRLDAHPSSYILKVLLAPSPTTTPIVPPTPPPNAASHTSPSPAHGGSPSSGTPSSAGSSSSSSSSSHLLYDTKLLFATCSSDRSIKLWTYDPQQHEYRLDRTLQGHSAWVWDCSFSADSAYLVSASSDKTSKLWDVKTGAVILEYRGHTKAITAVALNDAS